MKTARLTIYGRIAATALSLPLIAIILSVTVPDTGHVWAHLIDTTLGLYIRESLMLGVGVIIGTALLGSASAIVLSLYQFPAKRFFDWGMILPFVFPAYITGYAYDDMFSYGGWAYQWVHDATGTVLPVRSLGGAIFVFSFSLYPYVYLLVRATLKQQSAHLLDAARALGLSGSQAITRLVIPIVRPATIAACMLVMMEILSDYATVKHFGVHTFSIGIFRVWFGLGSLGTAAQMSLLLLGFTITLVTIEKYSRKRLRYYSSGSPKKPFHRKKLQGRQAVAATLVCTIPLVLGFVLPAIQLIRWIVLTPVSRPYAYYLELINNTVILGLGSALLVIIFSILFTYSDRLQNYGHTHWLNKIATIGYAVPGVIIAIGVLVVGAVIEKISGYASHLMGGVAGGILVSGTLFALYFAYTVRFITLGFHATENAMLKISPSIDRVAMTLNVTGMQRLRRLHIPLIRPAVVVSAILVFVDVVKEVPATLVLRPFNFNTLAVHTYELAASENLSALGIPALTIVLTSTLPLFILWKGIKSAK